MPHRYRDVAREVGVSEGTVRARVKKLEHLGALRILAFVDPKQLGNSVLALMLVRVESTHQDARRWPHGARRHTSPA